MIPTKKTMFSAGIISTAIFLLLAVAGCGPVAEEGAAPPVPAEKQIPEPAKTEQAALPEVVLDILTPKPPAPQTATLALKFVPQDTTNYRVVMQARQSIKFEGSLPDDPVFKGGEKDSNAEITFTRQIQSVDDKGMAVAKITINQLKYTSKVKDNILLDFDSAIHKGQDNALARLTGQSYTIKIAPTGEVVEVIDATDARKAAEGAFSAGQAASSLLEADAIKARHGLAVLPSGDRNQLRTGDGWSKMKTFAFPMLGSKSYEKIYTLRKIEKTKDGLAAEVEMSAIPAAENTEQLHKTDMTIGFLDMFDHVGTYTGRLKLDLASGKINQYDEELNSEWTMVDPEAKQKGQSEPGVMKLGAVRLYRLERID